ncbi:MAG: rod shape-determining protein RodA [Acidimicrobiales bacterium]
MITSPRTTSVGRRAVRFDPILLATTLLLAVVGLVMVYTATRGTLVGQGLPAADALSVLKRQGIFVFLGVVAMVVLAVLDYRRLEYVGYLLYGLMLFALLAVLVPHIGSSALGSSRWFSLGPVQVQPSEFAVLGEIVAVATYCSRRAEGLAWRDVVRLLIMVGIPVLLVVKQPDMGTAIIMTVVLMVMLAVAGLPGRILVLLVLAAVVVFLVALKTGLLHSYQISRLTSFIHQDSNNPSLQGAIYNLQQAKDAIGSGGMFGRGLLHGTATNLGYVPEQQTDFIFTAVGEQLGFVGGTAVLALLGIVCWRVLRAARVARDPFGRLLCAGIFTFLAYSTFQNAGMTMGIMPITGIPLPFVSYGGSAALCFFACVGVALSVGFRRSS